MNVLEKAILDIFAVVAALIILMASTIMGAVALLVVISRDILSLDGWSIPGDIIRVVKGITFNTKEGIVELYKAMH